MDYADAELPVADGVAAAHGRTCAAFAQSGAWWSGADRLAIVADARTAPDCPLCAEKVEALSPHTVQGEHASAGVLPPIAVEAIHGVRNYSGRLTRGWFDDLIDMGLQPEAYVDLVSVTASSVIIDTYAQGIGLEPSPLPEPEPGNPSFERSEDVVDAGAWLPLKREGRANVVRSLGLVPSALKLFFDTFSPSYYMRPQTEFSISWAQVELVASRVSAVNECFY